MQLHINWTVHANIITLVMDIGQATEDLNTINLSWDTYVSMDCSVEIPAVQTVKVNIGRVQGRQDTHAHVW